MTILRSGSTQKYSENWAKAFGDGKKKPKTAADKVKSTKKKNSSARKQKK